ncbi:MAG: hypothetical protein V4690_03040 [Patescibacteria group bacterium]
MKSFKLWFTTLIGSVVCFLMILVGFYLFTFTVEMKNPPLVLELVTVNLGFVLAIFSFFGFMGSFGCLMFMTLNVLSGKKIDHGLIPLWK